MRGQAAERDASDNGSDSRVNLSSASNSANIGSESSDKIFVELRDAARSVADEIQRSVIISNVDQFEQSKGTASYVHKYQTFIASAAAT